MARLAWIERLSEGTVNKTFYLALKTLILDAGVRPELDTGSLAPESHIRNDFSYVAGKI